MIPFPSLGLCLLLVFANFGLIFTAATVSAQPPPLAVFAWETNRPNGSKVIDMSSSQSTITGRIHCNSDINVSGTANYFRTGVVENVTGIAPVPNFQGKVTLQNCPLVAGTVQPWPVDYQASDFAPGGSEASTAQAVGKYFHLQGDTQLTAFMNNGELREGLYYVEGKVTISKGSLHGRVTIVATKEINISGTGENWQPYTRCLFLLSTKAVPYNSVAVNMSGGSSRWEGVIYAPNGGVQISGSGNTIPRGALIGRGVHLSGGNLNLTGMNFGGCAGATVTNQPPVVDAGPDQAIALPASATLTGSVSNDGLPAGSTVTVQWSLVSGPTNVAFSAPMSTNTSVSFFLDGIYVLRLTASDSQLSSSNEVTVTVNRENHPPLAFSQTVTNLEDTTTNIPLSGFDQDDDTLQFIVETLPAHGTLNGTPPNLQYTPTLDYNGADSFTFKVRDGVLESGIVTVTITNLAVNDAPVADSFGKNTPEDTAVTNDFSGSDVDSGPLTFRVVQQPVHGTLSTNATGAVYFPFANYHGSDTFTYVANDGLVESTQAVVSITVISVNDAPLVNSGPDQLISWPVNTVTLVGTVSDDDFDGTFLSIQWSLISGPAAVSFTESGTSSNTIATFGTNGTYTLRLAADDGLLEDFDNVVITVNAPPIVSAGSNQLITLPAQAVLTGVASDDQLPTNYLTTLWSANGPGAVLFGDSSASNTVASFSESGLYTLQLVADDDAARSTNTTTVLVNRAPLVDAGSEQIITNLFTTLAASLHDDGFPSNVLHLAWTKISGPGDVTFASPNATNTVVNFSTNGTYVLRLTADDLNAQSTSDITVIILPVNRAPFVSVGPNQLVILPTNILLQATVVDDGLPQGSAVAVRWTRLLGPTNVSFDNVALTNATVSFGEPGNYILRLTAHDGAITNHSDVTFVVKNEGMNATPVVNAGSDRTVGLTNRLLLEAFASDDGLPRGSQLAVHWSKVSGPGAVNFDPGTTATTYALFSQPGTYVLKLSASDSQLSATDLVSITVYPHNQPPQVDAGVDQLLIIPLPEIRTNENSSVFDLGLVSDQKWDPRISQPGLSLLHNQYSGTPHVSFAGLSTSGSNLFVSGYFYNAGDLRLWTLGRWNGERWDGVRDGNVPVNSDQTDVADFVANDSTGIVLQHSARGDELFVLGSHFRDFNGDGGLDSMARFTGSNWMVWGPQRLQHEGARAVTATSNAVYFGGLMEVQATNAVVTDRAFAFLHSGLPVSHGIAKWDGTNWSVLGDGISGDISAIAVAPNGDVYVGGGFMNNVANGIANNIAKWNGTTWQRLGAGLLGFRVSTLGFGPDGVLYAGGTFTNAGGLPANNIARWDGTNWAPVGNGAYNGVNGSVSALAFRGGDLYVGGRFDTAGGFPANNLARWSKGVWAPLGRGASNGVVGLDGNVGGGFVNALAPVTSGIYVGGNFITGTAAATNIVFLTPDLPQGRAVLLSGRVTDDNLPGGILSMQWTKISGPGEVNFQNASTAQTIAAFDQPGTYLLRLMASDSELSAHDEVTVEVRGNRAPVVDAGEEIAIGQTELALLSGHASDDDYPEPGALVYAWSKTSGPGAVTFANRGNLETTAAFGVPGIYVLRLTADDSQLRTFDEVTVTVLAANQPPEVNLYSDAELTFLPDSAGLHALVSDDDLPSANLSWSWSVVSGPGPVTFSDANALDTTATFLNDGTYVLRLTASDSQLSTVGNITVTVRDPFAFVTPFVYAGPDQSIPIESFAPLQGTIISGIPNLYHVWGQSTGPGSAIFDDAFATNTHVSFSTPGLYELILYAFDVDSGAFSYDSLIVEVRGTGPGGNQPPSIFVSDDRAVVITNTLTLNAIVTDDGLPSTNALTLRWSVFSGPGAVFFSNSNSAQTQVSFSAPGDYQLQLEASDSLAQSVSYVFVRVAGVSANRPPVISLPSELTVIQPTSLSLSATVTDDGIPGQGLTYSWSSVFGPWTASFSSFNSPTTTVSFRLPGDYILRLSANDHDLINGADVLVHVLAPTNLPPIVDAGPPQTIYLPTNSTVLAGHVYDDFTSSPLTYSWSKVSGSGDASFADSNSLNTSVTFSNASSAAAGGVATYVLRLTANDGVIETSSVVSVTIADPAIGNQPPTVNAGPDITTAVGNYVPVDGSANDDHTSSLSINWTQVNGPAPATIYYPNSAATALQFAVPGVYTIRLTVSDGVLQAADDLTVTVGEAGNRAPFVNAGGDTSVSLQSGLHLNASVYDDGKPSGSSITQQWSYFAFDGGHASFSAPASLSGDVSFDAPGRYALILDASDGQLTGRGVIRVTVFDEVHFNLPPIVSAGSNFTAQTGLAVQLAGTAVDDDLDEPLSFSWRATGPALAIFTDDEATNTWVQFSYPGIYYLELEAYDGTFVESAQVVVTVEANPNQSPVAYAGLSKRTLVGLPLDLSGNAFDDGLPSNVLSYAWSVISGPAAVEFANASSLQTTGTFSEAGDYVLRLTVSDGAATSTSDMTVSVTGGDGNHPPVVSAGPDQPATIAALMPLAGAVSDDGNPIGSVLKSIWSQVSGPHPAYFENANSTNTHVRFYVAGTYVLRLTANDSRLSSSDDVTFTVVASTNEAPLVLAGANVFVVRPHAVELDGIVFDDGLPLGHELATTWTKVSGPGAVAFIPNANVPEASATFSAAGEYVLRLTADDSQFTDFDQITVTVLNGTNESPVISTASNLVAIISTPLVLQSTVTDDGLPDGILQVTWSKVSGPGAAAFSTLNGIYRASFDTAGNYVIRIIADDSELRTTNDVNVTVVDAPNVPTVAIISPIDSAIITAPTIVTGVVQSAVLQSWALRYRLKPADSLSSVEGNVVEAAGYNWIPLATDTTEVNSAPLGTFDPTLLLNGIYELKLSAIDSLGRTSETEPITVMVDRNMKIGNFTVSFNDLTIPVAGIPIQVIRTYDSRDKRPGDFGVGWTLQMKDVRLQKNRHLGKAWDQHTTGGLFPSYYIDTAKPRVVTITFPDNKVYKFGAALSPSSQFGFPLIYPRMTYVPLENTHGTLTPVEFDWQSGERIVDDQLVFAGEVPGRADFISWELLLNPPPGHADNILYNPDLFEFRTLEGYTYLISETNGLRSMTDPNGNTLLVTTNGLTWTNAANTATLAVQFQRDALGRITNILDAMGHAMTYRYDTNGNLVTFTDRERNTNGFRYSPQHELLAIADARGIEPVRNEYDASGRLIRHIDANGKRIEYTHDVDHRLEIITNRLGFVTISEYDARGNVVKVTDALGATTSSAYDANDNLVMTVDPLGHTNAFAYDVRDNRTSVTDALGNTTRATYNDMRRVTSATDARGNVVTNRYDKNGNLAWARDAVGGVTAFVYDEQGLPIAMTNALGAVSRSDYDERGRMTNRIDALGHSSQFRYDTAGRVLAITTTRTVSSGLETLMTFNSYDALGRLTNVVFPDGTHQRTVFDEGGRISQTVDQLGRITVFEYDEQGRTTRVFYPDGIAETAGYDLEGRVTAKTNRMGFVTRYEYDAVGRVVRVVNPDGSSITNYYDARGQTFATSDALGRTAFYGYDALGRATVVTNALGHINQSFFDACGNLVTTINPAGQMTEFFYDALNRRTNTVFVDGTRHTTFYDAMGRRCAEQDAAGRTTSYGYDDLGRLIAVTNALGEVTQTEFNEISQVIAQVDALGHRTAFEHDALGRVVRTIFADGTAQRSLYDAVGRSVAAFDAGTNATWFGYDVMGRLVAITNALGYVTRYDYDDLGRQTGQIDANNHRTAFDYDSLGRRTKRILPGGEVESYFYDLNGNLTNRTDFNGFTTTFLLDAINRLEAKIPDPRRGEPSIRFIYNELGQRTNMLDASGVTTYRYDNRNRLVEKATPQGSLYYSYDVLGSVTNIHSSNANGVNVSYAYDQLHRLQEVNDPHTGRTPYNYDAAGNLRAFTHANGVLNYFEYDSLNRLTNQSSGVGLTTIANYRYALNSVGFRVNVTETLGGDILGNPATTVSRTYGYDRLYRLTNEIIYANSQNAALDYSYDAVGNRLSLHSTLGVIPSLVSSYTPNDRLVSDAYDNNGNTIGTNLRDPFTGVSYGIADGYDFENRLTHRVENGKTITIVYDGDGNRVKKIATTATNSVTTWFLVDTANPTGYAQVLEEITHNTEDPHFAQPAVSRVYIYGHALLSQQQFFQGTWLASFYGQDGHGSVRYLSDHLGFVTDRYDYDAFGNLIALSGSTPNKYLFTSQQYDSDLNLYYSRARYHNPQSGRFWSTDSFDGSASDPTSLHKYTYCRNNPLNCVDPSGNESIFQSAFTLQSGLLARSALGAGIGAVVGGGMGAWDAIFHGRITADELNEAVVNGAAFGALFGAAGGFSSGLAGSTGLLGLAGQFGEASLIGIGVGIGAKGVGQSFGEGHYLGGTFRLALLGFGLKATFDSYTLTGTLNSFEAQPATLGEKGRLAEMNRAATLEQLSPDTETPALIKSFLVQNYRQHGIIPRTIREQGALAEEIAIEHLKQIGATDIQTIKNGSNNGIDVIFRMFGRLMFGEIKKGDANLSNAQLVPPEFIMDRLTDAANRTGRYKNVSQDTANRAKALLNEIKLAGGIDAVGTTLIRVYLETGEITQQPW